MAKSHSVFTSILTLRCPRCRSGKLFVKPYPYPYKTMALMPDKCPVCGLDFNPEPGFYWGAMYVSYGLTVAFSVFNFLWMYLIWGWLTWPFLIVNAVFLVIMIPVTFRYARCIYFYIIQGFESKFKGGE
jgi:uncharacterized protein (DUF983 family)